MLGIHHYWLFIATAVVLILTPGQDTFFILGRSLASGRTAGIAAALGITAGSIIHAGAAYLLYIGVRALLSRASGLPGADTPEAGDGRWPAFRQGILSNLLNPKVALFFLALMPQFISAGSTNKVGAFLVLGLSFVALGVLWCLVLAIGAAHLRGAFLRRPSMASILNKVAGVMFIALGVRLATARQ
jgi:threonine/homoserine/homoserine lactone efflux protein